ncbi:MAG: diguanylate cyclase, partial [Comamonadaceae bacterium]
RKAAEEAQRVAAIAFEAQQAMFITDAQKVILRVNKAFTEVTGYTAEESVGQTPSLLKSGRQDPAFYKTMWECISRTGTWQGEIWNRRKNGTVYAEHLSVSAVKNDAGMLTHYVGSFSDLTAYKAAEEQIHDLAFTDLLTGLPNRRHLIVRLQQAITAGESQKYQSALLILNLDNFKNLNSTLGRAQCDQILQHVAKRLNAAVGDGNTVAHVEGDQFAVILTDLNQHPQQMLRQVEAAAGKMLATINQPYQLAGSTILCTASVGITFFAAQYEETIEPLKRAELALQQAKIAGRNTLRFFDADMQAVVDARIALEAALRQAINNKYFVLYYQAQVSDSEGIVGVEALIRWIDPKRGMVSPVEFIPLAEETGLILPIG